MTDDSNRENDSRDGALGHYRAMDLRALLNLRFYGSYVSGLIEKVIFEKIEK